MNNWRATLRRVEEGAGQLLEAHDEGKDLTAFEGYADDPIGFAEEVLGVELWEKQEEILRAVRDGPKVLVHGANAVGKDFAGAVAALWFVYARRGLVLVTAAVERQVVGIFMHRELGRLWRRTPDLPGQLQRSSLRIPGFEKVGVEAFTSTSASRITGWHAPRMLAILTEAQGLDDFAWEGMDANVAGAGEGAKRLALGNPVEISGQFRIRAEAESWRTIGISAREHPNVREGDAVIPGGPDPAFEQDMAETWGRDSPMFVARVLGEFPEEEIRGLFKRRWLEAAASEEQWREVGTGHHDAEPVVAVDVARHGVDETVAAIGRGDCVTRLTLGPAGADTTVTARWLEALCTAELGMRPRPSDPELAKEYAHVGPEGTPEPARRAWGRLRIDAVGIGAGVADIMRDHGWRVEDFKGGAKAVDSDRFRNRRTEAYWSVRDRLERGEVAMVQDQDLWRELLAVRWSPDAQGRAALERKQDLASRVGRSPDRADAVAMLLAPRPAEAKARPRAKVWGIR